MPLELSFAFQHLDVGKVKDVLRLGLVAPAKAHSPGVSVRVEPFQLALEVPSLHAGFGTPR